MSKPQPADAVEEAGLVGGGAFPSPRPVPPRRPPSASPQGGVRVAASPPSTLAPAALGALSPQVPPERRSHTMLGMIKNSLFGSVETWPWQVLSKGAKVGPQGCRGPEAGLRPPTAP